MISLKSENFNRYYLSKPYSIGPIFCIFMYTIAFSFAFFLAFSTDNMWLREEWYTEQPIIHARSEAILYTLQDGETRPYSTVIALNNQFENPMAGVSISPLNLDTDNDGITDIIQVEVSFMGTSVQAVRLYLFFDYGLRNQVKMQMQDFIQFDISSGVNIQKANIDGAIQLKQKSPLRASSSIRNSSNVNFFANSLQNVNSETLKQTKATRNTTITSDYTVTIGPALVEPSSPMPITINLRLVVPKEQRILYVPSILENLKLSWILYLAYLIPCYVIVDTVLKFAYRNKLVPTKMLTDLPFKRKTL